MNFDSYELIWIDETGFDLYMSRTRGRAKIGQRSATSISNQRSRHLTYTMGVSATKGLVHHSVNVGGVGKEDFEAYMREKLASTSQTYLLLIDNAPSHRRIEEKLSSFENCVVKRISPYTPNLNAVEFIFSMFKSELKSILRLLFSGQ